MEISRTTHSAFKMVRYFFCFVLYVFSPVFIYAQVAVKKYTVKEGKMYIEITRDIKEEELQDFIEQYDLQDLYLKEFVKTNLSDSLKKQGWWVEKNNETGFVISKPLKAYQKINYPGDRIAFAEKQPSLAERFPPVSNRILYGFNKFRNHEPFTLKDSNVTFYLRNHLDARKVMLAGSFNDWVPTALAMKKTDSGWIADVKLGPGKYWYKFIADGRWMVDNDNEIKENDGYGNVNSVFFRTNNTFILNGYAEAKNAVLMGSFNKWNNRELTMKKTASGWSLPIYLHDGTHSYKFLVDGKEVPDEKNKNQMPDGRGGVKSVIQLGKPYLFNLTGYDKAKEVQLIGSFNNWQQNELFLKRKNSGWQLPYVLGSGNYEYKFIVDGTTITDMNNPPPVKGGNSILVIQPNYTFRLKGYPNAKSVYLAGDFNNWNPKSLPMKRAGNDWVFTVHLSTGKHLYKFIIDGEWIKDPNNKLWEQNEFGTGNSIVWIENSKDLQQ